MFKKTILTIVIIGIIMNVAMVSADDTLGPAEASTVTIKFINQVTGELYGQETNTIKPGGSWGIGIAKFNNKIANHITFKSDGYKYTFNQWESESGETVTGTQRFYYNEKGDYTINYYAVYDKEVLGILNFELIDDHGHNGHRMSYHDEADYKFTFKEPVDVEENYTFLYYQNRETGDIYNPGDVLIVDYDNFKGQELSIIVDAVYQEPIPVDPIIVPENDTNDGGDYNETINTTGNPNNNVSNIVDKDVNNTVDNAPVITADNNGSVTFADNDKNDTKPLALPDTGNSFALLFSVVLIIFVVCLAYWRD